MTSSKEIRCTLVPSGFFKPEDPGRFLFDVAVLDPSEKVSYFEMPRWDSWLVYSGDTLPMLYYVLDQLPRCAEYNRIVADFRDGVLSLGIAQGENLLFANTFVAVDFTTAEYYIFAALKSLQMNPEQSTIVFRTELSENEQMSLYRYFKSVEICVS